MLNKKRFLLLAVLFGAAVTGVLLAQPAVHAQDELVVGTYDPQQIAEAANIQQKMQQEMAGLQQKLQSAQQQQDQAAMQQVQQEAMDIQQRVIDEFEKSIDDAAAAIAEEAGVDVVAQSVAYTASGIETKDVTSDIIAEMTANGAATEEAADTQEEETPAEAQ